MPPKKKKKEEKRFGLTVSEVLVTWPCHFGSVVALYIMVEVHSREGLFTSWQLGSKERETRESWAPSIPFKGITQ
jgi:hypothetical protein